MSPNYLRPSRLNTYIFWNRYKLASLCSAVHFWKFLFSFFRVSPPFPLPQLIAISDNQTVKNGRKNNDDDTSMKKIKCGKALKTYLFFPLSDSG